MVGLSIRKAYDKLRIHSDNSASNSQPKFREDNIAESIVEMLEHVHQVDNEEMPNARDVKEACFKRRATAVLSWLDCSSTAA